MRVAFQGEIGAFSEQAVRAAFPSAPVEIVPLPTFESVFESLTGESVDRAVVPIENSLFGSVHANYDLLRHHDVRILGEVYVRVIHNLLVLPGTRREDILRVLSHPQALGQCQDFLRRHFSKAEIVPAYDTAGAAKMVSERRDPHDAAIASEAAAREYGLEVLDRGIESNHENFTRFLVLARLADAPATPDGPHLKTSIVYAMRRNLPGALFKALAVFALRDLDLFKIESRPLVGSPFEYLFYLDFAGSENEPTVQRALEHLAEITAYLKVLGSYPRGGLVDG